VTPDAQAPAMALVEPSGGLPPPVRTAEKMRAVPKAPRGLCMVQ